jgi:Spy/CpxP family protein refolding chaperone
MEAPGDQEETTMSESTKRTPERQSLWRRKETWAAAALAVLGAAVVAVPSAMAFRGFAGHGGHGFAHDPEQARERASFAVEWAFRAVDATEEQRQDGQAVVERLVDQLVPLGELHREHREAVARELVRPQIDRAALERLREEGMAMADEASRIAVAGVADLAEVLSPEQRAELLELAHRFHRSAHPSTD